MELYVNAKHLKWYKVSNYLATFENLYAYFKNVGNVVDLKIDICIDFNQRLIMIYNIAHSSISRFEVNRPILLENTKDMYYDLKKLHDWDQLKIFFYGDDGFFNNFRITFALHPFIDSKRYKRK